MVSIIIVPQSGLSRLSTRTCLNSEFDEKIESKFGLFNMFSQYVFIKKSSCEIKISFHRFSPSSYEINFCKNLIHIKRNGFLGEDIYYRKDISCQLKPNRPFCQTIKSLFEQTEMIALTYAKGEKTDLSTAYSKVYCVNKILRYYLHKGVVLDQSFTGKLFEIEKKKPLKKKSIKNEFKILPTIEKPEKSSLKSSNDFNNSTHQVKIESTEKKSEPLPTIERERSAFEVEKQEDTF